MLGQSKGSITAITEHRAASLNSTMVIQLQAGLGKKRFLHLTADSNNCKLLISQHMNILASF